MVIAYELRGEVGKGISTFQKKEKGEALMLVPSRKKKKKESYCPICPLSDS